MEDLTLLPYHYKEWVKYLKGKKIYGAWIQDISAYAEYCFAIGKIAINHASWDYIEWSWDYESSSYPNVAAYHSASKPRIYLTANRRAVYEMANMFTASKIHIYARLSNLNECLRITSCSFKTSNINWRKTYEDFIEPHPKLSTKLSRKLTRASNIGAKGKKSNNLDYKEIREKKEYEKYIRRAWRKK